MSNVRKIREEIAEMQADIAPLADRAMRGEPMTNAESAKLRTAGNSLRALLSDLEGAEDREAKAADLSRTIAAAPSMTDRGEERAMLEYLKTGHASAELRAAGEATGSAGGYLVPPGWWQRLQVALKAYGGIANDFTPVDTQTGQSMLWAGVDPTSTVGTLIAEGTAISEIDYSFGQGTLSAYTYTSGVQLVSFQLAQDSAFDVDGFINDRVGESIGRAIANAAVNGTGSAQPLGIYAALKAASVTSVTSSGSGGTFTPAAAVKVNIAGPGAGTSGIQQETEVSAGVLAPATIQGMLSQVDRAYRLQGAKFYMNDATLQAMKWVSDGYGRPLYPGLQNDAEPQLVGYEVVVDNNLSAVAASKPSVVFGHLPSAMVMRTVSPAGDGRHVGLLRLDQRFADQLQIGYIGYSRIDIRSNDTRAAVVLTSAAS